MQRMPRPLYLVVAQLPGRLLYPCSSHFDRLQICCNYLLPLQCTDTDFMHWSRLPGFGKLHTEVVRHGGRCPCEHARSACSSVLCMGC